MANKSKKKKTPTITFEYKISPNYSVYSIAGIQGGLNAQGDIIANIFSERPSIPKTTTHEINDNKTLGKMVSKEQKNMIIRDVIFGLSINPSTARIIADWLNKRADDYEKIFENQMMESNNGKKLSK